jgi:hypothetical protein
MGGFGMSSFNALHMIMGILGFILGASLSMLFVAMAKDVKILKLGETIVDTEYLKRLENTIALLRKKENLVEEDV